MIRFDKVSGYMEALRSFEYVSLSCFDYLEKALTFDKHHQFLNEPEVKFVIMAYVLKCPDFFSSWTTIPKGYVCDTKAHKFKFVGVNEATEEGIWELI